MAIPTMTAGGLQQGGGAEQQITVAGMEAWLTQVNGYRRANAGKKRLFTSSREELIRTSRRDVD